MSSPSLTQQGRERKARIYSGKNRTNWDFSTIQKLASEGGPMWNYEGSVCNTPAFRKHYDDIKWNKKEN